MEIFTVENLTFTYPNRNIPALSNLNFNITAGEFVVICGQSGSGKSTLLKNMKPILTPHGVKIGQILYYGKKIEMQQTEKIGYVFQNPDNQIVTEKVWHELAFGLENMGLKTETIRLRVAEMASFFGIQNWFDKEINHLSGGQKQLLNLASIMVMQPDVLLLDEPTSQLDPIAASDFLETVKKINREIGTTILMTEHRLENVIPMADKVIVLEKGKIIACDTPSHVGAMIKNHPMFLAMPAPLQAYTALSQQNIGCDLPCPIDVREGRNWLTELLKGKALVKTELPEDTAPSKQDVVLKMKEVWFKYDRQDNDVIKDLSFEVYRGELFCLVGGNGTGKTTTLNLASGIEKPYRGKIKTKGKWAILPQNPQNLFVGKTVKEDFMELFPNQEKKIKEMAEFVKIETLLEMHPYDLSGGEQQRAALAKVLLLEPDILYLDEPTKCLDNEFKIKLGELLKELTEKGVTIVMVSHDVEFCGKYADRCAMFFDGKIVVTDTPRHFFSGNHFYTTAANRMSRHIFKNAIHVEDIVNLVRGNYGIPAKDTIQQGEKSKDFIKHEIQKLCPEEKQKVIKKKNPILIQIMMLLLAIGTIYVGLFAFEKRHYILTNILLVLYAMVPFFYRFEKRKPKAREIVLLAVMIAIATVGRAAFFMIPNFKPTLAIVIIAGICLGKESGFFIGSMSAFVSNFLFGQGPWTPYQMIATAVIGYLAGLFFYRNPVSTWIVAFFGGIAAFFIYGGIVDLWTIFYMNPEPSIASAVVVYSAATYFNAVHAVATILFLSLLTEPMMQKINRVKIKYGIYDSP